MPDVEQLTDLQGTLGLEIVMADNIRSIQCILALSGWGQEEDRRASMEAGFNAHLVKPVDMDVLLEMLSTIEHRGISR
ncbi:hypothetical protein [Achromobacter sp.]|uniref:hypothetical protein n=1 Tax=Achromobacter sp. TaxID=134375 RepID=UPI0028AD0FCF|nr:hypothetical protein [Achromobacter sp.]